MVKARWLQFCHPQMKVRLTKKHAERIDGIDLSGRQTGDVLDLPHPQAYLLLAEQWAIVERRYHSAPTAERRRADDSSTPRPPMSDTADPVRSASDRTRKSVDRTSPTPERGSGGDPLPVQRADS